MEWNTVYTDMCKEIEILEIRREDLIIQLHYVGRIQGAIPQRFVANYSGMPGGSSNNLQLLDTHCNITEEIADIDDILDLKREAKRRMEKAMSQFSTLEYRVAYMRDVERKSLVSISMELGYSHDWIRKISSRTKRLKAG